MARPKKTTARKKARILAPAPERSPEQVLFSYFAAMVELNRVCMAAYEAAGMRLPPNLGELREQYAEIRKAHFTTRKRVAILSWGRGVHDEYNPRNIEVKRVTEESKKRVSVYVHNTKRKDNLRYVLILRENRWCIDGVKTRRGPKWVSAIL